MMKYTVTTMIIAAFLFSPSALGEKPRENIDKSKEGDMIIQAKGEKPRENIDKSKEEDIIMQAKMVKNAKDMTKDMTNQSAGEYEG